MREFYFALVNTPAPSKEVIPRSRLHQDSSYVLPSLLSIRNRLMEETSENSALEIFRRTKELFWAIHREGSDSTGEENANGRHYSLPEILQKILGKEVPSNEGETLPRNILIQQLSQFMEDLSLIEPLPIEAVHEPFYSTEELQRQFGLLEKVKRGYRNRGLIFFASFLVEGRRVRGVLESDLEEFCRNNPELLEGTSDSFGRLPGDMRARLIADYRSRIEKGLRPDTSQMMHHPQEKHPAAPENDAAKLDQWYMRVMRLPLRFVGNEDFENEAKENEILAPPPEKDRLRVDYSRVPKHATPALAASYAYPLLTPEQEPHLFRQYNYLKFRAWKLRESLNPIDPDPDILREIYALYNKAQEVRSWLTGCNLRIPISFTKPYHRQGDYIELLEEANASLVYAIEKFDYGRGFKFISYCGWAIKKNMAGFLSRVKKNRRRFISLYEDRIVQENGDEEYAANIPDHRENEFALQSMLRQCQLMVRKELLPFLPPREHYVVSEHHALRGGLDEGKVMEEIAPEVGMTKQNVSNILSHAMQRLERLLKRKSLTFPEGDIESGPIPREVLLIRQLRTEHGETLHMLQGNSLRFSIVRELFARGESTLMELAALPRQGSEEEHKESLLDELCRLMECGWIENHGGTYSLSPSCINKIAHCIELPGAANEETGSFVAQVAAKDGVRLPQLEIPRIGRYCAIG